MFIPTIYPCHLKRKWGRKIVVICSLITCVTIQNNSSFGSNVNLWIKISCQSVFVNVDNFWRWTLKIWKEEIVALKQLQWIHLKGLRCFCYGGHGFLCSFLPGEWKSDWSKKSLWEKWVSIEKGDIFEIYFGVFEIEWNKVVKRLACLWLWTKWKRLITPVVVLPCGM